MITVSRAQLSAAIEAGIASAAAPTEADKAALRAVAGRAEMVAFGTFTCGSCGCPLVQARLTGEREGSDFAVLPRLHGFYPGYDREMTRLACIIGRDDAELAEVSR